MWFCPTPLQTHNSEPWFFKFKRFYHLSRFICSFPTGSTGYLFLLNTILYPPGKCRFWQFIWKSHHKNTVHSSLNIYYILTVVSSNPKVLQKWLTWEDSWKKKQLLVWTKLSSKLYLFNYGFQGHLFFSSVKIISENTKILSLL